MMIDLIDVAEVIRVCVCECLGTSQLEALQIITRLVIQVIRPMPVL